MHWRRKRQPTPVFLPGESQGWGSLVGCSPWGCTESDTTEATQQQQQLVHFVYVYVCVSHSVVSLCNPVDYSLPGSSVYGILQTIILEWVAIPFSRGSSQPRDQTHISCTAGRFFKWVNCRLCGPCLKRAAV